MANTTRGVVAVASLSLAAIPTAMLWSSAPPSGTTGIVLTVAAGVGATACGLLWMARFPSKNQSVVFAVAGSASIAAAVLAQSDPVTALLACTVFAASVIARAGGEEFLVADVVSDPRPVVFGQRLCEAIAALPYPITASVGTATIQCGRMLEGGDREAAITVVISAADAAMYEAKRNGGNQTRHELMGTEFGLEPVEAPVGAGLGEPTRTPVSASRTRPRERLRQPGCGRVTMPIVTVPDPRHERRRRPRDARPETRRDHQTWAHVTAGPSDIADHDAQRPGRHRAP
jgi:hypothetical protein